jgi:hypothetical protein
MVMNASMYGPRSHSRYLANIRFADACPGNPGIWISSSSFGISAAALSASVAKAMQT